MKQKIKKKKRIFFFTNATFDFNFWTPVTLRLGQGHWHNCELVNLNIGYHPAKMKELPLIHWYAKKCQCQSFCQRTTPLIAGQTHGCVLAVTDGYLMFHAQSTAEGQIRMKPNACLPQVNFWFTIYNTFHRWQFGGKLRKWSWMSPED